MRIHLIRRSKLAALALLALSSCSPEAGLHLVVEGNAPLDRLVVSLQRSSDDGVLATDELARTGLPVSINFVSGPKTPSGTQVRVTARSFLGDQQTAEASAETSLQKGEGTQVTLVLSAKSDGGVDGGELDGGVSDAGALDAGELDGGSLDGGTPDAGDPDAGSEDGGLADGGTTDAGVDAGPPDRLLAYYPFDATGVDLSPNGHDAVLMPAPPANAPVAVSGQINNGYSLDGVDDYLELPADILTDGTGLPVNDFTFAAWVFWRGGLSYQRILDFHDDASSPSTAGRYMFMTPLTNNTAELGLCFVASLSGYVGGFDERLCDPTAAFPIGAWVHVAVTLEGNTGTLYINRTPVAVDSQMTIDPSMLNATGFWFGRSRFVGDPNFNGILDEVRLYGRALSAAEISALP